MILHSVFHFQITVSLNLQEFSFISLENCVQFCMSVLKTCLLELEQMQEKEHEILLEKLV